MHAIHVPHLIDSEIASAIRSRTLVGSISSDAGWQALNVWQNLAIVRYTLHGLLERIWDLRDNFSAYDAGYVALAEALGCTLITADSRLVGAPDPGIAVTVVPRQGIAKACPLPRRHIPHHNHARTKFLPVHKRQLQPLRQPGQQIRAVPREQG